jgi:hypothetical protein
MANRNPRPALALSIGMAALLLGGCNPAQPTSPRIDRAKSDRAAENAEAQSMAEAALGKQAEVLAHGDFARNGLEQILAINRLASAQRGIADPASPARILILRAAVLEKRDGKWTEVLRCDERLKNPNGYLAGSPAARVTGWRLEYNPDAGLGLQMKFTPADIDAETRGAGSGDSPGATIIVGWNNRLKRYQSLDQSHERFLNEVPTLETPLSILK